MNVLFEDDGHLKTGAILADNDSSLQVESASGKRMKVKASNVLLRFASPAPTVAMQEAEHVRLELDATFLWEVSGDGEFGFAALARDYFGGVPSASQQIAVAQLLHGAPMHFYKKGKGLYRRAPAESLRAALASVDRKAREAEQVDAWAKTLAAGRLPPELAARREMLLYHPDKQALEWKALAAACDLRKTSALTLLAEAGALPSTHDYHFDAFRLQTFPRGLAFPAFGEMPVAPVLPRADVEAFSIDDATTTEIDDAFSVRALPNGNTEIGIHIAAPALAIARGSPLDVIARERLSTVYMPGRKITMLPESVIDAFTLAEGDDRPALSLYIETAPDGTPLSHRTAINRVPVVANLRLDAIPETFAHDDAHDDYRWTPALRTLWKVAGQLAARRARNDTSRVDFNFAVDWSVPDGRVAITTRKRGSPLDKLVSELMIHVNATWGKLLAEAQVAGLYRVQSGGKVKMSARPGEHQGLGLSHYLWSSSPLRRFSDLANQQQLLAAVSGERPPYGDNDAQLYAALADFEATYGQYAEFQDRMEHYWSLRYLLQEGLTDITALVVRDTLVRFERVPLWQRLADMPPLPPDTRVRVGVGRIDLIAATVECRYAGTVDVLEPTATP